MILEILLVSILGIFVGILITYALYKKRIIILTKIQREKDMIINNPDLLLKKLNSNGRMVDCGEELKYSIVEEGGKRHLDLKKTSVKKNLDVKK